MVMDRYPPHESPCSAMALLRVLYSLYRASNVRVAGRTLCVLQVYATSPLRLARSELSKSRYKSG